MKRCLILLMLILSLMLPAALAEDAAYFTPGQPTQTLFVDAFSRGDMVLLDMQFDLDLNENAEALFGEDAAVLDALAKTLEHATLTVGAGKIENGLRIQLAGDYAPEAGSAALDLTLDVTKDGVALMSGVMPEDRLTAKWETLLALCGLSEEEIVSILSLRDADFEALLAELLAQLEPIIDMAAQIAAPYGETILAHITALPMVVSEDVPAEYGYPAAATEIQIQVTLKAFGDLITALAEQLKQDATLCAILDSILTEAAEGGEAVTTAQLCDAVIQAAAEELTDETLPLNIFMGMDEAGSLLYLNIINESADGTYLTFNYIAGQLEDSGAYVVNIDLLSLTAEQEILDGLSFVVACDDDDANPNVASMEMLLSVYADGAELAAFSLYTDNAAVEGQNAYAGQMAMTLDAADGESVVSMNVSADIATSLSDDGGEQMTVAGSVVLSADGQEITSPFEGGYVTTVKDGAPASILTESMQLSAQGIDSWSETYTLYTAAQPDLSGLTETALEAASPEALEALAGSAMTSLEATLTTLFELLPPELMALAQEEPAAVQP